MESDDRCWGWEVHVQFMGRPLLICRAPGPLNGHLKDGHYVIGNFNDAQMGSSLSGGYMQVVFTLLILLGHGLASCLFIFKYMPRP